MDKNMEPKLQHPAEPDSPPPPPPGQSPVSSELVSLATAAPLTLLPPRKGLPAP